MKARYIHGKPYYDKEALLEFLREKNLDVVIDFFKENDEITTSAE